MKNRSNILYLLLSFLFTLLLVFSANEASKKGTIAEKSSARYDVTLHNIPIEVKIDEKKYYAYGYDTEVEVQLSSYNQIRLQTEENEATRSFKVVADFSHLKEGTHEVPLRIEGLNDSVEAKTMLSTISVTLDKRVNARFEVQPKVNEDQLGAGFTLGKKSVEPKYVTIETGEKLWKSIDHLEVELPAAVKLDHDYSGSLPVKALDRNGKVVSILPTPKEVRLKIEVVQPSKQVALQLVQQGELAKNVIQVQLSTDVKKVQISGLKSEIDKLDVLRVPIDVSNVTEEKEFTQEIPHSSYSVEPKRITVKVIPIFKSDSSSSSSTSTPLSTSSSNSS